MNAHSPTLLHRLAMLVLPVALLLSPPRPSEVQAQRIQKRQPRYQWHRVASHEGIVVHAKDHPDRELPSFRGVGTIDASIYNVMAVLEDTPRHTEWMERCVESRVVKRIDRDQRILYNRTEGAWPVADRDVVVHGTVRFQPAEETVVLHFRSLSDSTVPKVEGVVRMAHLSGYYRLVRRGPDRTHVTYQVNADPGGSLPKFIVKWVSRAIPIKTIMALRKQAGDMRGRRRQLVEDWKKKYPFG